MVDGVVPPILWVWGREKLIVLPASLMSQLSTAERSSIIMHELAHLKRRDHWVRALELMVLALYWWHPAAWWARRELQAAEELCCDAWVIHSNPQTTRSYGRALLQTIEFLSDAPVRSLGVASSFGTVRSLKRRMHMIVHPSIPHRMGWSSCLIVLLVALLVIPIAVQVPGSPGNVPGGAGSTGAEQNRSHSDVANDLLLPPPTDGAVRAPATTTTTPAGEPQNTPSGGTSGPDPILQSRSGASADSSGTAGGGLEDRIAKVEQHLETLLQEVRSIRAQQQTERATNVRRTDTVRSLARNAQPSALSADGKISATATSDGIQIMDVTTGKELRRFVTNAGEPVKSMTFNQDGADLVVVMADGSVQRINVATGILAEGARSQTQFLGTDTIARAGAGWVQHGGGQIDLVRLATEYNEAVGNVRLAKLNVALASTYPAKDSNSTREVATAEMGLENATRKFKLLRSIAELAVDGAKEELEYNQKLTQKGFAPASSANQSRARLRILELILSDKGGAND
jgi:hypothetical protein